MVATLLYNDTFILLIDTYLIQKQPSGFAGAEVIGGEFFDRFGANPDVPDFHGFHRGFYRVMDVVVGQLFAPDQVVG